MIIKINGKGNTLFANFSPAHQQEIFKYFDPKNPEKLYEYYTKDFLAKPSTAREIYHGYVQVDEYNKTPILVYLSCLTQPTVVYRTAKETGNEVPTAEALVSLYHKDKSKATPIVSNILLDGSNRSAIHRFTADLNAFKCDYSNIANLDDLQRRLFLTLNIGVELDVTVRPGSTSVIVYFRPTDTVITDRTFLTL